MPIYFSNSSDLIGDKLGGKETALLIDIDSWLYSNGIIYEEMNQVREWIFIEWLSKKINSRYSKKCENPIICVIFSKTNQNFIDSIINNIESLSGLKLEDPIYIH